MLQNNALFPNNRIDAGCLKPDHVMIRGRTLELNKMFDEAYFEPGKVRELSEIFQRNEPFPHLVFEDLLSPVLLELMYEEFDAMERKEFLSYSNMNERKLGTRRFSQLGRACELYFNMVHSGAFVQFLEQLTGIEGLITDPGLTSCGLHQVPTGGKFSVHLDFNRHELTKLDNRLIFITYLNKDWLPAYGGQLELWSPEEEKCAVEIVPAFGRSILFAHSPRSLHGHPSPVDAPNRRPRRSAAVNYYSNGRPANESTKDHSTIIFRPRKTNQYERMATSIKYMTPPVVVVSIQKIKAWWRKQRRNSPQRH